MPFPDSPNAFDTMLGVPSNRASWQKDFGTLVRDTGSSDLKHPAGADLFKQLVREQVRSLRFGLVPLRFWRLSAMDDAARKRFTRDTAWPAIRRSLDANTLTPIGLIRQSARNPFKLVGNPLIFPTEEDLSTAFEFADLETKVREQYDREFNQVIGA